MEKSLYYEDQRKEQLLGQWLDIHLYNKYTQKYKSIERIIDKSLQKKGIDVRVTTFDNRIINIDEKCSMHYINEDLPTFAFEILNSTSGNKGWLYNNDLKTDYYLLCWPHSDDITIPSAESFTYIEAMYIERKKVSQLLEDNNIFEDDLIKTTREHLGKNEKRINLAKGINLYFNYSLYEKPVNVVIKKELLKTFCKWNKMIY